jgi:glyoxylase I family protein
VSSPDGLIVAFTQDPEDVAEIDAARRADAHEELTRWFSGDRRTNNELRGRHI